MKISYSWLKSYLKIEETPEYISEVLTDIGLEVEGTETFQSITGGLEGMVIGKVMTIEKHPDADRLNLTTVDVGGEEHLHIVCGAPNVDANQTVVVATVGAELFPLEGESFKIKQSKIRGQLSQGMICGPDEIGLGEGTGGVMVLDDSAKVGTPAGTFFNVANDIVFEIGLTPNRVDGSSHYGVARDLAAGLIHRGHDVKAEMPTFTSLNTGSTDAFKIEVHDTAASPRYAGVLIKDLKVAPSPDWLQIALKSIGLAPINNVVDITNFVLHELGQPLHAFDYDKIDGHEIHVKTLPQGTTFTTLDGEERKLDAKDLMICDATKPMCIAGVFGGEFSGVTDETTSVFLESAYFNPVSVRKTAKRHGLNTDASFRFERGVDPEMTKIAIERAASLLVEVAGGKVNSDVVDCYPSPILPFQVSFDAARCNVIIGHDIPVETIENIIKLVDIKIVSKEGTVYQLEVPAYRVDVTREIDVIEEVLRIYGFNNIPLPKGLKSAITFSDKPNKDAVRNNAANLLSSLGFAEMMMNSLSSSGYYTEEQQAVGVKILNPLSSELDIMRQELLWGGLEVIKYNLNRKSDSLKLYEFGNVYRTKEDGGYEEHQTLDMFMCGRAHTESWNSGDEQVVYADLKGTLLTLVERLNLTIHRWTELKDDKYAYGMEAHIGGKPWVTLGLLKEDVLKKNGIKIPVLHCTINWSEIVGKVKRNIAFKGIPKFPSTRRDLAMLIDEGVEFSALEAVARKVDKKLLTEIGLFDVYRGKNLPAGKKSYAMSFIFQDEYKTLTDKGVDKIMDKLMNSFKEKVGAEFR